MFKSFFVKHGGFFWLWHALMVVVLWQFLDEPDVHKVGSDAFLVLPFIIATFITGIGYHIFCVYEPRKKNTPKSPEA